MSSSSTTEAAAATPDVATVRERIERNPYLALAGAASVGWVIGRRLRLPLLGAVAAIVVRVGAASVIERVLTDLTAPRQKKS